MPSFSCLLGSVVLGVWPPTPSPTCVPGGKEKQRQEGWVRGEKPAPSICPSAARQRLLWSPQPVPMHGRKRAALSCKGVGDLSPLKRDLFLFLY